MNSRFETLHQLLSQYTFEMVDNITNDDLICIICKKLMIDASQTSCGCQYCYNCIRVYLSDGNEYCPGGNVECKEQPLLLERDVFRNVRLSMRISKVIVKCPNNFCNLTMELSQAEQHLQTCSDSDSQCPYATVGCVGKVASKDRLLNHLNNDMISHTQLMISFTNNIKNDFDGLMKMLESLKLEIKLMQEDLNNRGKQFLLDGSEISIFKENIIVLIEQEIGDIRNELETVTSFLRLESKTMETKLEEQRRDIEILKSHIDQMEGEGTNMKIADLNNKFCELQIELDRCNEDRERKMNNLIRLNKLRPNIDMDFMWRIDDYSKKKRSVTDIYSDSFYSNNYKLCLNLYIYGDNIGLWCVIMRGEKDDYLEWPMRRTVTLSILDQDTLVAHKSAVFQYDTYQKNKKAFEKPKNERNEYCIGTDSLIRYSLIKDSSTILSSDSIVVSCVVR